jgi:hypothetical protein
MPTMDPRVATSKRPEALIARRRSRRPRGQELEPQEILGGIQLGEPPFERQPTDAHLLFGFCVSGEFEDFDLSVWTIG